MSIKEYSEVEWPAEVATKMSALEKGLKEMDSVLVAYSGGVDSAFLAAVARGVLEGKALAVTAMSPSIPERELKAAEELARDIDIRHRVVVTNEMDRPGYAENEPDRCYHCKSELFSLLREVADGEGLAVVLDGNNADDLGDFRPGSRAAKELGVRSPLQEYGFTKNEIRIASKAMGLSTASKPASACLASRIPYGTGITTEALKAIERAEDALHDIGFAQVRVRAHGDIARVEVLADDIERLAQTVTRGTVTKALKECGFRYIALDLDGYRTGSMNEALGGQ